MKNEQCAGCPFSKKIIRKTKPMLYCTFGRYASVGGYPCAWIKSCEHDKKVKGTKDVAENLKDY